MKKILFVFLLAFALVSGVVSAEETTTKKTDTVTIMADPGGQPIVP